MNNLFAIGQFNSCDFFPCNDVPTPANPEAGLLGLARFGLNLIFAGLIIYGIVLIVRAALKYISSEGDVEKAEAAQKMIRAVFIGIGMLFVGIIGIVILLTFFGVDNAVNETNLTPPPGLNL